MPTILSSMRRANRKKYAQKQPKKKSPEKTPIKITPGITKTICELAGKNYSSLEIIKRLEKKGIKILYRRVHIIAQEYRRQKGIPLKGKRKLGLAVYREIREGRPLTGKKDFFRLISKHTGKKALTYFSPEKQIKLWKIYVASATQNKEISALIYVKTAAELYKQKAEGKRNCTEISDLINKKENLITESFVSKIARTLKIFSAKQTTKTRSKKEKNLATPPPKIPEEIIVRIRRKVDAGKEPGQIIIELKNKGIDIRKEILLREVNKWWNARQLKLREKDKRMKIEASQMSYALPAKIFKLK